MSFRCVQHGSFTKCSSEPQNLSRVLAERRIVHNPQASCCSASRARSSQGPSIPISALSQLLLPETLITSVTNRQQPQSSFNQASLSFNGVKKTNSQPQHSDLSQARA
ncbi:hypothetical protein MPSEU_000068700 [Mayamaea pseudoterrestris]|nr:hypothetical protein MPSEU_000068700 [Mayamaea pseudoterrestris]